MLLKDEGDEDLDTAILEETPGRFDKVNQELDFTSKQTGVYLIDRLVYNFEPNVLPILNNLINKMTSGELEGSPIQIRDNIISTLIRIPYSLNGRDQAVDSMMNIMPIFEYISKIGDQNPLILRRLPSLVTGWYDHLNIEVKSTLMAVVIKLLDSKDPVT